MCNHDYYFKGGELAVILGDTKLGKTAFVQYLVTQFPDMKTLFMSLEVSKELIIRRFFQCALSTNKYKIDSGIDSVEGDLKSVLRHFLRVEFRSILFGEKGTLSLEENISKT